MDDDHGVMASDGFTEAISAIIDGEDPGIDERLVDAHVARCASCRCGNCPASCSPSSRSTWWCCRSTTCSHAEPRARTALPVAGLLALAVVITAVAELIAGRVPLAGETLHIPEIISVLLMWLLAVPTRRPTSREHGNWTPRRGDP